MPSGHTCGSIQSGSTWSLDRPSAGCCARTSTHDCLPPAERPSSFRIPESALHWDSGFLMQPGNHFDVTLTVPGVYDYYCIPHEAAGMVGRITCGETARARSGAIRLWAGRPEADSWRRVPDPARETFPSVAGSSRSIECILDEDRRQVRHDVDTSRCAGHRACYHVRCRGTRAEASHMTRVPPRSTTASLPPPRGTPNHTRKRNTRMARSLHTEIGV